MVYSRNSELIRPLSIDISYRNTEEDETNDEKVKEEARNGKKSGESSRWNPTAEQIKALEEIYSGGTRTPTTQQIQDIASKLRHFGRIEGKNVFYWFQNHKARDRLKRRRLQVQLHLHQHDDLSVLRRTGGHRVEQTNSCPSSSATQDLVPANNKQNKNSNSNGTTKDSERIRTEGQREATWQMPMIPSCISQYNNHLIIESQVPEQEKEISMNQDQYVLDKEEETSLREIRTLNLFPVSENQEVTEVGGYKGSTRKTKPISCNYFYEFMPLKN